MIKIKRTEIMDELKELKHQYLSCTTGPLDGMWLTGFIPTASHFGFYENEVLVGFCCINEEGYMLQFHLCPNQQNEASTLFRSIIAEEEPLIEKVNGAFSSTAEPQYFSHCLDNFSSFKVNCLMYRLKPSAMPTTEAKHTNELNMKDANIIQLKELVKFAKDSIGAPEEWLTSYYTNLIKRKELFGVWEKDKLIATGECRGYDEYQTGYADLGVIVAKSERKKGLATRVLRQLVVLADSKGLHPICSTEKSNMAAQKAIVRAGFFSPNRIVQFDI